MVKYLFHPFKDDLLQHFQGDFQSSLRSCDADPFQDADLFYEDFQSPSSSILVYVLVVVGCINLQCNFFT
jgi:hypothetical protein